LKTGLLEPKTIIINSKDIAKGSFRLDSYFYSDYDRNYSHIINNYIEFKSLGECSTEIYEVPPFVHVYVKKNYGIPFYTSSSLFENDLTPAHYLTPKMKKLEIYKIRRGQILLARSGDVSGGVMGLITMVGRDLDGATTSDHVIRITANPDIVISEYLYCFLMSEMCRKELVRNASGSVIPAIRPAAIKNIHIPMLPLEKQNAIVQKIRLSIEQKEASRVLIFNANRMVLNVNGLAEIKEEDNDTESGEHNKYTSIFSSEVLHTNHSGSEYRLDAHFYNPLAQLAIKNIRQCKSEVKTIGDVTERVFMCGRFKRNYVGEKYGVPFLSGKNIIQIRPTDLKYISLTETSDLDDLKLEATWTLITRSGTIGRTCFVWGNYEEWTATEDIVRAVPSQEEIDPGYLCAFLSSPYGKQQVLRFRHGSVIDHITPEQVKKVLIPLPSETDQKMIGDLVRAAYEKRAEAIRLEDEAQQILMAALTQ